MVLNNIEHLLEKYSNAETSLQEEAALKAYFNSDHVAPHLQHYKPLFVYFSNAQQDTYTKTIPLHTKKKRNFYKWISVAAVSILMLGIIIPKFSGPTEAEKQEALLAYNQTIEVLNLVSLGLNKGKSQLQTISLVSDHIEKGTAHISVLSEFNNATNKFLKNK